jgi:phage shock protein A
VSISDRLSRVMRANLNELIARAEDPRKILDQALLDLREDHARARADTARAMAEAARLRRELRAQEERAATMQGRAERALREGREDLARIALRSRRDATQLAVELGGQLVRHGSAVTRLQARLEQAAAKIAELEARKRLIAARASTVRASAGLDRAGLDRSANAVEAIERMERKVLWQEDEATARESLDEEEARRAGSDDEELAEDEELEDLRRALGLSRGGEAP